MSCDLMSPQGTAHSGLGLAWSDSSGRGANLPSGPASDHRGPQAEGRLDQWVSGAAWEAVLQEAGPEQGTGQRYWTLSLLLQGCQGHHWRHHVCQHLCLHQGWVTSSQTHTHKLVTQLKCLNALFTLQKYKIDIKNTHYSIFLLFHLKITVRA